jgi:hypothetical protein
MKDSKKPWLPLWVDSWLFGSTRLELSIEQRATFTDFLCLACKDTGFIRANEGIPYPTAQLAGLLGIPEALIIETIDRCLEVGKIERKPDGTLYVTNWERYQLTPRHKRRLAPPRSSPKSKVEESKGEERKADIESAKADIESAKEDILPPIPHSLTFKAQEELRGLRVQMRDLEKRLKTEKDQEMIDWLKKALSESKEKYLTTLKDFEEDTR